MIMRYYDIISAPCSYDCLIQWDSKGFHRAMHTVIVIAAQQDHRRKSRIETTLKLLSDIKKEMTILESDETIVTGQILIRKLYWVSFRQILM